MNMIPYGDDFKSRTLAALSEYEDSMQNRTVYDETPYSKLVCDWLKSAAEGGGDEAAEHILEILRRGASDETVHEVAEYLRGIWPGEL